jgi:pyruvate,orthophosphate dikinase
MEYKDLLGGKGANLAEMMSVLNLPVPHGFTISTDACRDYMHGGWPKSLTCLLYTSDAADEMD